MKRKQRESKTSKRRVQTRIRENQALKLRLAGHTYPEIGEKLGISAQAAHQQVTKLLDELRTESRNDAERLLQMELARLDEMQKALAPKVQKGNTTAIDRALDVMRRRASLLGLDAPKRRELSGPGGQPIEVVQVELVDPET